MTESPRPKRILVVDDDDASRYLVESLLKGGGFDVVSAADGEEALATARAHPVDLLISDILMPKVDGYRLAREWKADPALSSAPVMFYTATYTDAADERFANDIGADRFVTKPQEPDAFLAIVRELLAESPASVAPARSPRVADEAEVLREYSARLVNKLEDKIVDLNAANAELRKTLEVLSDEVGVKNALIDRLNRDISDRQDAEAALLEANEALDEVIESSPLPIVALDKDYRVVIWNSAAERLFGWSREEVLGRKNPAVGPEWEAEQHKLVESAFRGTHFQGYETRRVRKDGSPVDVAMFTAVIRDTDGEIKNAIAFFQDVTERRRIEELKGDFISTVSHELRTPLTAIVGFSELMRAASARGESCDVMAEKVHEKANELRVLIEELLEAAGIQAGSTQLALVPASVADFLDAIAARTDAPDGFTLVLDLDDDLLKARIDAQRLGQAIESLLANAFKYSPKGGTVRLSARRCDGGVTIAVSDEGVGIPAEHLEHVFESFTQADMSTTREFGGIGLGLFMAKRVVEAHGGTIRADGSPGHGSTFTIELPPA